MRRSTSSGRSMPRSALNSVADVELARPHLDLAGFDLGEIEQVVDQLEQRSRRRLRMNVDLLLLLAVSSPSTRSSSSAAAQDRVQRRAELVAHVRTGSATSSRRRAQVLGLLVELGVERDHAAVGVLQLAVQPLQLACRRSARRARAAARCSAAAPPRAASAPAAASSRPDARRSVGRRCADARRGSRLPSVTVVPAGRRSRSRTGPSAGARR